MIGSAGRLCPVKDYSFMIDVAKAVKEDTKHIKFHLAGEGPERSKLQTLIQEYNLNETFVLKGHLDDMLPVKCQYIGYPILRVNNANTSVTHAPEVIYFKH